MSNVLIPKYEVNRVTTRGGKMTYEAAPSKEINETRINKNEPPMFEQDMQEKPHDVSVKKKYLSIHERTTQPLVKPQQSSIPFLNRVRKEKEDALQREFLENLKQLDINIPFIEALVQIQKHAKYLKSLLTNKSKLKEDCTETMNKRFENPHKEVLNLREIADKFSDEHLMVLKSKKEVFLQVKTYFWEEPYALKLYANNIMRRCVAESETLEILAHYHSRTTGGHHSVNVTAKKVYKSRSYWSSIFKDANEYVRQCEACQRSRNISSRNEMPQNNIQLNELAKLRDGAYENTIIYKEQPKKWHDSRRHGDKDFRVGDKVLLYNPRLKMYPGKLKSK
nr:putative reverse transcriptase domain-containing protein [Tanacetum cinerariifolium]